MPRALSVSVVVPEAAQPVSATCGRCAALERRLVMVEQRLAQLEAARGRSGPADDAVRRAVADVSGGAWLTADEILAAVPPRVLEAALIEPDGLGYWLRSARGVRGVVDIQRAGRRWRAVYTCDT